MPFTGFDPTSVVGGTHPDADAPMTDDAAMQRFRRHAWVYSKMLLCQRQGIRFHPYDAEPDEYPVVLKPAVNPHGGSEECLRIGSVEEYRRHASPWTFAMPYLPPPHWSIDCAVVNGGAVWFSAMAGSADGRWFGAFHTWRFANPPHGPCVAVREFVRQNLPGYTGMVNAEVRGGNVITDFHLRDGDSYLLGGSDYVDAVAGLYDGRGWKFDRRLTDGWLFPVFVPAGTGFSEQVEQRVNAEVLREPGVRFVKWDTVGQEGNPPGCERVCLVVADDERVGRSVQDGISCRLGV